MHFLSAWTYTLIFGTLFLCVLGANLQLLWSIWARQERPSMILFMGGFFGVIACLCAPVTSLKYFAFVPLLLDPGAWLLIPLIFAPKD